MEARRNDRAKENICRTAGPGRGMERLWVYDFSSYHDCLSYYAVLLEAWDIDQFHNDMLICLFSPGRNDPYLWPHHSLTKWVSTTSLRNPLFLQREWDHVVDTNEFVSLSTGSIPLPTALPPTGWLVQPLSPRTCIPLCLPTRYWGIFRPSNLHC